MSVSALPRLLLVEDDPALGPLIAELLASDYQVTLATDGQKGLHLGLTWQWEVIVIDRGLPILDGMGLISALRRQGISTPALILTALGATADKVDGLDAGANDYMSKPFDVSELKARLRALTRNFESTSASLEIGDWILEVSTRSLSNIYGLHVSLAAKECELLTLLAHNPHKVFSRNELIDQLFHADDSPGVIDTYVHYLRRKLGKSVVRTVHGLGYQIGEGT